MSFSPLDGLMMATRCGALDPAVVLYLARAGKTLAEIEDLLYRQSGLLGVSGISGDMRVLIASKDPRAREALDLFTYRAAIEIASLAGALGGLDGLVFTAGNRRTRAVRPRRDLRAAGLAWAPSRPLRQRRKCNAHRRTGQPDRRARRRYRRGANDRAPYAGGYQFSNSAPAVCLPGWII